MNIHKNARLTFVRRQEMVQGAIEPGPSIAATATRHGVRVPRARKRVERYPTQGSPGLRDAAARRAGGRRAQPTTTSLIWTTGARSV
jgi:transposase-like protein